MIKPIPDCTDKKEQGSEPSYPAPESDLSSPEEETISMLLGMSIAGLDPLGLFDDEDF